jgi:hypothetical protein
VCSPSASLAGMRALLRGFRAGQIAAWLGIAGSALLAAFAVQVTFEVGRPEHVPTDPH